MIFGLDLGPHAFFIVAAYAVAASVIALMVAWTATDYLAQRRTLANLEARGITRRAVAAAKEKAA